MITLKIHKAQVYALHKHSGQEYGLGIPYSVHLTYVVMNAMKFIHNVAEDDRENVIVASWGHDLLEDAGVSFNDLKSEFGEIVAHIIYGVTNELGHNRKEKSEKTLPKTAKNRLSVFVKLCDKIANTEYSKITKSRMYKQYVDEHESFKDALYQKDEYEDMWKYLEELNEDSTIRPVELESERVSAK